MIGVLASVQTFSGANFENAVAPNIICWIADGNVVTIAEIMAAKAPASVAGNIPINESRSATRCF